MATNTTSHHLTPTPSTIGYMNSGERVRDELAPPAGPRPRGPPSPRTQSKSILTIALQKAQSAVQFDSANNVVAALDAYKQTVELLSQVIDKAVNDADRRRLQLIHDTYADRIRLLSTIVPSNKDNDEDSTSEKNNKDDASTQSSADSGVNVNSFHRTDSIERKSIHSQHSQTDLDETSTIQDNERKSVERASSLSSSSSSSIRQNVDTKIDNSDNHETRLNNGTTLTNGIDHNNGIKENMRNNMSDYVTPKPKRLSNTSTLTSKSWVSTKSYASDRTTPASIYEISVGGTKSTVDSGESTPRSSDLDSNSDDTDAISNTIIDYLQNSDSNSDNAEEHFDYQNQNQDLSQQKQEEKHSITTSQNSPLSSLRTGSSASNRLFVPPPPPKIAPPSSPNDQDETQVFYSSPSSSLPENNALLGRRSTSPSIVPPPSIIKQPSVPSGSPSPTLPDEDDDKASVKSVPNAFTRSSSPPPQNSVEKLFSKGLPHSRRPAPLPLVQPNNYNSRAIPARSPSNPTLVANQSNSTVVPRRTASNPGNTPRKSTSVRFFNSSQHTPSHSFSHSLAQTPNPSSPWMNSFSPLGSPGFGPPTGTFRSETPSTTKTIDANYTDCLLNPFSNTSFYDDIGIPHMSSNNGLPEPPPNDPHLKPFWLMKLLERTMTTGGYLTPKLFIPRHLWLQGHVKLTAIDTKISSCEVVSNCLEKLAKTSYKDMDKLAKELEGIDPILEGLQNSLARKLSYVDSTNGKGRQSTSSLMSWGSKLSRGLDRMGMGNAMVRTEEANGYVDVLIKVFQHVDVVENYIHHFSSLKSPLHHHHHKQIIVRLHKFSDFFGNVICRFVIRDLGILTDKYLKKGSQWIIE